MDARILCMSFNEDYTCFAIGLTNGFCIYGVDPLRERFHRILNGGIGVIAPYGKTNLVFLVGGGMNPAYPPSKLILWDDRQNQILADLEFPAKITRIKPQKNQLMVQTENKIYIYQIENLGLVKEFTCGYSPSDFCSLPNQSILAYPGRTPGKLKIEQLYNSSTNQSIKAHSSKISQITISADGILIATCSERGTLIRIWNVMQGVLEKEFRRGLEPANIKTLIFHPTRNSLLVSSDRGTVHVYTLEYSPTGNRINKKSSLGFIKDILPMPRYFHSEWSMVSFQHNHDDQIISFGPEINTIIIIDKERHYTKYRYHGDNAHQIDSKSF